MESAHLPCTCLIARPFCGIEKVLGRTSTWARATRAQGQQSLFMFTVYRSALNALRCFCFSVSGKGEMFFTVIANTLLAD